MLGWLWGRRWCHLAVWDLDTSSKNEILLHTKNELFFTTRGAEIPISFFLHFASCYSREIFASMKSKNDTFVLMTQLCFSPYIFMSNVMTRFDTENSTHIDLLHTLIYQTFLSYRSSSCSYWLRLTAFSLHKDTTFNLAMKYCCLATEVHRKTKSVTINTYIQVLLAKVYKK